jgi:hypothetical protein
MSTQQEQLYLKTIDDLNNRISSHDPFDILSASVKIRKLFLDDRPLVDLVSEQYTSNFTFDVCLPTPDPSGLPEPAVFSIQEELDPDTSRPGQLTSQLARDQFLKIVLININGTTYTIKDVVLSGVTSMGAVHSGSAKSEKEKVLKAVNDQTPIGGYASSLRQIQAIGRIMIKALTPLTLHIQNKPQ